MVIPDSLKRIQDQLSVTALQQEMNRMFDRVMHGGVQFAPLDGHTWAPVVDVLEREDSFLLRAEVPGLMGSDIDVSVSDTSVGLRGTKVSDRVEGQYGNYLRAERNFGTFSRTIDLPVAIDAEQVTASCHSGVLEVVLPKKQEARSRSVRIQCTDTETGGGQ